MNNEIDLSYLNEKEKELFNLFSARNNRDELSSDDLIELASLYESMHCEDLAFEVYQRILKKDPHNSQAMFWYSHFILIYRGIPEKEVREKVFAWAEELIRLGGEIGGMGYSIKAHAIQEITYPKRTEEEIYALRECIRLCPDWSLNYVCLAALLEDKGELQEALELYERAQNNVTMEIDPNWGPTKSYFESCIAARTIPDYSQKELISKIDSLRKKISGGAHKERKRTLFSFFRKDN